MKVMYGFKLRNKAICCLLIALMVLTALPMSAFADQTYKQNTVTENANTATVPTVSEEKSSDLNELPESEKSSDKELIKQDKKDPAIELKLKLTKEVPFDIPKEKSVPEPQTVYLTLPGEGYQPYRDSVIYQTLKDKGMLDIFDQLIQHEANPADEQLPEEIVPEVEKDPNGPTPEDPEQPTEANDPQEDDLDPDQGTSPEEGLLPENGDSHSGASGDTPVSPNKDENPLEDSSQPTQSDNSLNSNENGTLLDDTDLGVAENQILLPDALSLREDGRGEGENDESEAAPGLANGKDTNVTDGSETEITPKDQNDTGDPSAQAGGDITDLNNPDSVNPPEPEAKQDKSEKEDKKANRFSELEPLIGTDIVNLMSEAESQKAYYNTLVGPSAINGVVNEQYSALRDTDEVISPLSGDLTLKVTDIKLPGRNGLDLNLGRLYQSNQAMFGDRKIEGDGINGYNSHSTYFLDRYSLGVGWSLTLPSVQVEKDKADEADEDDDAQELYYHTGDGAVYHVEFTDDPDDSNLEKYHRDDIRFEKDTTFNNTQVDSAYVLIRTDQTKTYFADDGRLLGIVDRFGNSIVFNHEELPVSNLVINGDFENPESRAWHSNEYRLPTDCFNYDTTFGKDDNSSLKYGYVWGKSSISETDYIAVEPNTNYYVSCYMNDQLSGGHTFVSVSQYRNLYGSGQGSAIRLDATEKNTWEFKEGFFTTGPNTHYVQVKFGGGNYSGYAWLDKVRLDKAWPLISKITDSIGREIDFEYTDTLNEDIGDAGTITVTVNNPDKTDSVSYTYTRNRNLITCGTGKDAYETRYSTLFSSDNGDTCNAYEYNCQDVSWKFDSGATPTSGIQALLSNASVRNSKIQYDYTKKSKFLGNFGSHEVYRVSSRREFPQLENDYSQTPRLVKNYSYEGALSVFNFNDETSYSSYHRNFYYTFTNANYTCTIQQDNGLETNIIFHGSPIGWVKDQIVKIKADGERDTTTFEEYDTKFKNQPVKISTKQYDATYNDALYAGYTYNDWGGIESETRPLTQTEWDDASAKEQLTISYAYDPTFKFLTSKAYYQDEGIQLAESSIYDYNGRLQATVNAKGETTDFQYEDDDHMGNVTKVLINHQDGIDSITEYDYSGAYNAYPTAITQFYTENNQAQSSTTEKTYEFVRGLITSVEDAAGQTISYEYDDQGRVTKVVYPSSVGIGGSYVVEDNYDYGDYIVADLDNRSLFRVHFYRTWDSGSGPETFFETIGYYDDHGVLQQSRKYDFEKDQWITTQYGFNDYGQIISTTDPLDHQTSYEWDEWNRLQSITDTQGNQQVYEYDILNRTKKSYFVPQSTGAAENHHLITYDQWGREISRSGYPDGWGQPNEVEETFEYDYLGNLIQYTDPENNQSQYQYDPLNRLIKVIDPLNQETGYDYDRLGNVSQVKQSEGLKDFITTKGYDERGLLTSKTEPEGQAVSYQYNQSGLPVTVTDATGKVTTMEYENNQRLQGMSAGPDTLTYYYHPLGGVERTAVYSSQGGAGESLDYGYYSTGLTSQRKIGSYAVDFQYDDVGNRTQITDPFNQTVNYQYDSLNRVDTITADNKQFSYEYYADGMIKAVNYPNGLRTEYTYDNINRLTELINKMGANILSEFSYAYDKNSNIIAITSAGQTTTYQYDPLNRLTGIKRPNGEEINYQYDSRGNRSKGSITTVDTANFKAGEFTYNSWDELDSFTGSGSTAYSYAPEGLRIKKDTGTAVTRYFCDNNGLVVAESDGTGQVTAQNIWGHKALARNIDGNYYYYLYNGHGDVIQILDEAGNTVNSYSYDEWGNILTAQEQIVNPMKYAGEYYDEETGLYYLRARYYDPTIGRFISKDSYEGDISNPLSLNLYTYCNNNPINMIDLTGHAAVGLRDFANTNGYSVSWNASTRTATISRGNEKSSYSDGVGGTYIDSGGNMIVNSDFLPNASSSPYTAGDRAAGVNMAVINGKQYLDVSIPINNALANARSDFASHKGDYAWFYNQVRSGGPWDIKLPGMWESTIKTSFPGSYDTNIVLFGQITTPETLGNVTYGYLGSASDFSQSTLLAGSMYAAGPWNIISDSTKRANEFNDHYAILQGINWYNGR